MEKKITTNVGIILLLIALALALAGLTNQITSKSGNISNNLSRGVNDCYISTIKPVHGDSLSPYIHNGEKVKVLFNYYDCHPLQRGDIVVLHFALRPNKLYLKRLLGLPGDKIKIVDNRLWINGHLIKTYEGKTYLFTPKQIRKITAPLRDSTINPGYYLVLSNQVSSTAFDSRFFGYVEKHHIVGKIVKLNNE